MYTHIVCLIIASKINEFHWFARVILILSHDSYVPAIESGWESVFIIRLVGIVGHIHFIMACSIKLFQTVQALCRKMGIHSDQSPKCVALNWRNFVFLSFIAMIFLSATGVFFFQAQTISEYGFSFYLMVTGLTSAIGFVINIWKRTCVSETIVKLENFIEKRECIPCTRLGWFDCFRFNCIEIRLGSQNPHLKSSYAKLSDKIERVTKALYFLQINIFLPLNMLPPLLTTLVNYYILDMEDESFLLPFPTMYETHSEFMWRNCSLLFLIDSLTNRCNRGGIWCVGCLNS